MFALWDDDNDKLAAGPQDVGADGWLPVIDTVGAYDPMTQAKKLRRNGDQIEYFVEAITPDWAGINRGKRDRLLVKSDWSQLTDAPLTDAQKTQWQTYRQALRDLPEHVNWPNLEADDWPQVGA